MTARELALRWTLTLLLAVCSVVAGVPRSLVGGSPSCCSNGTCRCLVDEAGEPRSCCSSSPESSLSACGSPCCATSGSDACCGETRGREDGVLRIVRHCTCGDGTPAGAIGKRLRFLVEARVAVAPSVPVVEQRQDVEPLRPKSRMREVEDPVPWGALA